MARESITWIDSAGSSLALNDQDKTWSTRARTGLFDPNWDVVSEDQAALPGSIFQSARLGKRTVSLPVELRADSHASLFDLLRLVTSRMNPTRGEGKLRIGSEGGITRELRCRPLGASTVTERDRTASLVLGFEGDDPLWYETTQQSYTFTAGAVVPFFPIFPVRLMTSAEYAEGSVANGGDENAWPVWTVTGPAKDVIIVNNTSGKTIDLTGITVTAGVQLVIDCEKKTILLGGVDTISTLTLASELYPLLVGSNSITVKLNNQTSGTAVSVAYTRRYFTP